MFYNITPAEILLSDILLAIALIYPGDFPGKETEIVANSWL